MATEVKFSEKIMSSYAQHRFSRSHTTTMQKALPRFLLSLTISFIFLMHSPVATARKMLEIPLQLSTGWQQLTYNNIKSNQVSDTGSRLLIEVNQSASPLIYAFPAAIRPTEVSVSLQIKGDIDLAGRPQGDQGADDFVFRIGLVHEGEKTLNFMQRAIAAGWIKKLYSMAPEGAGIDSIEFYNVYSDDRLAGSSRIHPLSDLMIEHFVAAKPQHGHLDLTFKPEKENPVLALWISIDGDDTKSSYEVLIEHLQITTQ